MYTLFVVFLLMQKSKCSKKILKKKGVKTGIGLINTLTYAVDKITSTH